MARLAQSGGRVESQSRLPITFKEKFYCSYIPKLR